MAEQAQVATPGAEPVPPSTPAPQPVTSAPASRKGLFGLSTKQAALLGGAVVLANLPLIHYALRGEAPVTATVPFTDDFNRADIGENYFTTGGLWRIENGWVHSPGVKNNPLWLKAKLPEKVAVEFDVRSEGNDGDVKCEIFGNGRDHSSGYVVIFGGWSNTISTIARLDEHGKDRKETRAFKVEKGRTYHFRIERQGTLLRWYADNQLMMEFDDPAPLRGKGHDRFGFSTWETDVFFDNLSITPL